MEKKSLLTCPILLKKVEKKEGFDRRRSSPESSIILTSGNEQIGEDESFLEPFSPTFASAWLFLWQRLRKTTNGRQFEVEKVDDEATDDQETGLFYVIKPQWRNSTFIIFQLLPPSLQAYLSKLPTDGPEREGWRRLTVKCVRGKKIMRNNSSLKYKNIVILRKKIALT